MLVIVDGDSSFLNYLAFEKNAEKIKLTMKKMDKELTFFVIGPQNIVDIVKDYCLKNEDFREKRVKFYTFSRQEVKDYGLGRFNLYINLKTTVSDITQIDKEFVLV